MNKISYLFIVAILMGAYMYSNNAESIENRKANAIEEKEVARAD